MGANTDRIDALLEGFAALSEPGQGVTRLAYSSLERTAHERFADEMRELGLPVWTDAVGNTLAELSPNEPTPGRSAGIGTGSHLDSVPEGGRFDGVVGVIAGLEVARLAASSTRVRTRPWRFVAFAAEEGARFGQACNGSRVAAGLTTAADLHALEDAGGVSAAAAMTACGLHPDRAEEAVWSSSEWAAFVELHIEQGSVLEASGAAIGVVEAISGSTRLEVAVHGVATHSGGTPMNARQDALTAAAECILYAERLANDFEHHRARVTVGRLTVHPNAITTIPGEVRFWVDVRDVDSARQRETADRLTVEFEAIANRRGLRLDVDEVADTSPVYLPASVRDIACAAAADIAPSYRVLSSGASHDSQQINRLTPTALLFVPSRAGLSHTPDEHTDTDQIRLGISVLMETLYRLDAAG